MREPPSAQRRIHPRFIKKGLDLYSGEGTHLVVVCVVLEGGVYKISTVTQGEDRRFVDFEWDAHQYGEEPEPIPELYRKNPLEG